MNEGGSIGSVENYLPQLKPVFEKHGVVLAYLYGSQARGNAGPLSDVDIAVLFAPGIESGARFDRLLRLMSDLAAVFKRDDVNVLDLDEGTPLLNNNVRLHGHLLYAVTNRVRAQFEEQTLRQYVDTKPIRDLQGYYLNKRIRAGKFADFPLHRRG